MLTYSLDEYGDFEGLKQVEEPMFIAGLIYDDQAKPDEEDLENNEESKDTGNERRRVADYYRRVIAEAAGDSADEDFKYPAALHSNGDKKRDGRVIRPVKQIVKETLPEFLKNGTYRGQKLTSSNKAGEVYELKPRKGRYHIFVILKSDKGKEGLLAGSRNILAKDNYASNLYFHMADELIERIIFFNPLIPDIRKVTLNIATRSSGDLQTTDALYKQYISQDYTPKIAGQSAQRYFELTNADIYRTVISKEIINSERSDFVISEFEVESINYKGSGRGMEFLYLADSIASILSFKVPGNNADEWLHEINARTRQLTGKNTNLIFGYDEIDTKYAKAMAHYLDGDLFAALSMIFDAGQKDGAFAELYCSMWFKKLEEQIIQNANASNFTLAVRSLQQHILSNRYKADMCVYIQKVLEKIADRVKDKLRTAEAKRILYTMYDNGVSIYSHIGDSKKAQEYFEQCIAHAGMTDLEEYLSTRNKMVVFYCDYFELDKALEVAEENISYQELLADFKKEIDLQGSSEGRYLALGKALSAKAQVYAFMRDASAEETFRRAMEHMEEGSANYKITQSYLLHYYLDAGMEEEFLAEEINYFDGRSNLSAQLSYILEEGAKEDALYNMKFAFYILLRGAYLFRQKEVSKNAWGNLCKAETQFAEKIRRPDSKQEWQLTGHPAELIFKYLRLLAIVRKDTEKAALFEKRIGECLENAGPTVEAIRMFGAVECADVIGEAEDRNKAVEKLCEFLVKEFDALDKRDVPKDAEGKYLWVKDRMTFMYR